MPDGQFCPSCSSPVHQRCAVAGASGAERCAECGVELSLAAEFKETFAAAKQEQVTAVRQHHLFWGIGSVALGILLFGAGVATVRDSLARSSLLWWGAIVVGLSMLLKGIVLILAAIVARRR